MEDLHTELKRRIEAQDDGDYSTQGRIKRRRVIPSDTEGEFSKPEEGRNPEKVTRETRKEEESGKSKSGARRREAGGPRTEYNDEQKRPGGDK
jgi:hypothetical protein